MTSNKDLDPIRADEPIKHAGTEANKEASPPLIPIPPTSTQERNLHPLPNRCEITCKTEKNWWDQTKPYVELAGIVLLFVYTLYTIKMYSANSKSADAAKSAADTARQSLIDAERSLAATSAAECSPILDNRSGPPYMNFHVNCVVGKVDAILLGGSLQISLRNPHTGKSSGHSQTIALEKQLIPPGKESKAVNFDVENFSMEAYLHLAQAIIAEGSITYDDGFGRQRPTPFCFEVIPYLSSNGVYNGMQTVVCDLVGDTLRKYEQQEKEQKHK